ncbi:hypothetical protein [Clostridium pasteurianum]|nr:hypothetical protein [Clostridium pasteurianum]
MVEVDENNKPKEVPRLELSDEEEIIEFKKGIERYEERKLKR